MLYEIDKCKHCGKEKGQHQYETNCCPIKVSYARAFSGFHKDQFFEPKKTKTKPEEKKFLF